MAKQPPPKKVLLEKSELPDFVGLSATRIDLLVRRGEFPPPTTVNKGKGNHDAIGRPPATWLVDDVVDWQQARIAAAHTERTDPWRYRAERNEANRRAAIKREADAIFGKDESDA